MKRVAFLTALVALTVNASVASAQNASFEEITTTWSLRQPSSSSEAERDQAALNACNTAIHHQFALTDKTLQGTGIKASYRNVSLVKRFGTSSKTKMGFDQKRSHEAHGSITCSYYRTVSMN